MTVSILKADWDFSVYCHVQSSIWAHDLPIRLKLGRSTTELLAQERQILEHASAECGGRKVLNICTVEKEGRPWWGSRVELLLRPTREASSLSEDSFNNVITSYLSNSSFVGVDAWTGIRNDANLQKEIYF